eukprot:scaffold11475_cov18-Prasinocladus_malaysianus.AAC.1
MLAIKKVFQKPPPPPRANVHSMVDSLRGRVLDLISSPRASPLKRSGIAHTQLGENIPYA